MFVEFFFAASLAGLVVATLTDLKSREIPDKLTYALIALGVGGHLLQAVLSKDYWPLAESLGAAAFTFAGAYALWRAGVWAGGDVKLFTALAVLNPVNYGFLRDLLGLGDFSLPGRAHVLSSVPWPVFPLTLFVFSVFSMMPYGVFLSLSGLAKNPGLRTRFLQGFFPRILQLLELSVLGIGLLALTFDFKLGEWLVWPLLLGVSFLPPLAWHLVSLGSFGYAVYKYPFMVSAWGLLRLPLPVVEALKYFLPLLFLYVFIKLYRVSKEEVLKRPMKSAELAEGVIVGETLIEVEKGKIVLVRGPGFGEILSFLKRGDVKGLLARLALPPGRVLASASRAAGLTSEEAAELRALAAKKAIPETVKVKLSAPFVPAILIAYVLLQLVGDVLWRGVLG